MHFVVVKEDLVQLLLNKAYKYGNNGCVSPTLAIATYIVVELPTYMNCNVLRSKCIGVGS